MKVFELDDISDDSFSYISEEAYVREVLDAVEEALPSNLEMHIRCVHDCINGVKIVAEKRKKGEGRWY
jgi:hypothetical protein